MNIFLLKKLILQVQDKKLQKRMLELLPTEKKTLTDFSNDTGLSVYELRKAGFVWNRFLKLKEYEALVMKWKSYKPPYTRKDIAKALGVSLRKIYSCGLLPVSQREFTEQEFQMWCKKLSGIAEKKSLSGYYSITRAAEAIGVPLISFRSIYLAKGVIPKPSHDRGNKATLYYAESELPMLKELVERFKKPIGYSLYEICKLLGRSWIWVYRRCSPELALPHKKLKRYSEEQLQYLKSLK